MSKAVVDFIGVAFSLGLFINSLIFIPQIMTLWREKHANEVSLVTFAGFNVINILAVLHGISIRDWWLVAGDSFSVASNSSVTVLIIWYRYLSGNKFFK